MPSSNPSLRAAETSEELEILRAHSVNYSDKAAEVLSNAIGQLKFVLYALTKLAGGGQDRRRAGCFFENKLACKKGMHLSCKHILPKVRATDGMIKFCSELQAHHQE
jgi:hypothetical protein